MVNSSTHLPYTYDLVPGDVFGVQIRSPDTRGAVLLSSVQHVSLHGVGVGTPDLGSSLQGDLYSTSRLL